MQTGRVIIGKHTKVFHFCLKTFDGFIKGLEKIFLIFVIFKGILCPITFI